MYVVIISVIIIISSIITSMINNNLMFTPLTIFLYKFKGFLFRKHSELVAQTPCECSSGGGSGGSQGLRW